MIRTRVFVSLAVSLAVLACTTTDSEVTHCINIPLNGCPLDGTTDVCTDPCCATAQACNPDGSWTTDHTCSGFVASACGRDAAAPIQDAGPDATPDTGAAPCVFDAGVPPGASTIGGTPCIDLEPPDCPIGEVLACNAGASNLCAVTGCESLYICELTGASAGWVVWGECEDDGGLVLNGN